MGIWKIEEPEAFFRQRVPDPVRVSHPYKRLQHLAGRYLLTEIHPGFPLDDIRIAESRKPFLEDGLCDFSLSHCGNYAAALVSTAYRVGLDIEIIAPSLARVAHKFLHAREQALVAEWRALPKFHLQLLALIWSAKEAIYKWHGTGQLSFSRHLCLDLDQLKLQADSVISLPFLLLKGEEKRLKLEGRVFDGYVLVSLLTPDPT